MIPALVLSTAMIWPTPTAFVIDCGSWPGGVVTEFRCRVAAADGTASGFTVRLESVAKPDDARALVSAQLLGSGWQVRQAGESALIVEGTKTSPVRSVELTSTLWAPTARPLFTRTADPPGPKPADKK